MRRFAVDCDGVLFDFNTRYIEYMNKLFDAGCPPVSSTFPNKWSYDKDYISSKQEKELWNIICGPESYSFWRFLPAFEWSKTFLSECSKRGEMVFITSRCGKDCQRATEDALKMLGVTDPQVIIAHKKGPVAMAEHITDFLDDKPENHYEVDMSAREIGATINQWLLTMPWNAHAVSNCWWRIESPMEMLTMPELGMAAQFVDALGG